MGEQVVHGKVEATVGTGETRRVEAVREELLAQLVGLGSTMCAAMDAHEDFVPCEHAFGVVIEGVAAAAACEDEARLAELSQAVRARSEHVAAHRGVPQGEAARVDMTNADAAASLLCALGAGPCMERAMRAGTMSQQANVALVRLLACLGGGAHQAGCADAALASAVAGLSL